MKTFPCFATDVGGLATAIFTAQRALLSLQPRHLLKLIHVVTRGLQHRPRRQLPGKRSIPDGVLELGVHLLRLLHVVRCTNVMRTPQ